MRKVFFFYFHKDKYYSSSPIVNNFKILQQWQGKFLEFGIEISSMLEFLPEYKDLSKELLYPISKEKVGDELMKAMENIVAILPEISGKYEKIIFLGFHPSPFQPFIRYNKELKKYNNIQTILWQDDLHAYFEPEERKVKLDYADHCEYSEETLSSLDTALDNPEKMSPSRVAISAGKATSGTESTATAIRTAASRRVDASLVLRAIKCSSSYWVIRIQGELEYQ